MKPILRLKKRNKSLKNFESIEMPPLDFEKPPKWYKSKLKVKKVPKIQTARSLSR